MEITLKQPLALENFFNYLYVKYPEGMKVFCDWVDQYKLAVDWNTLFNSGGILRTGEAKAPKFHELPYALQLGIFFEFIRWNGGCEYSIENINALDFKDEFATYTELVVQPKAIEKQSHE